MPDSAKGHRLRKGRVSEQGCVYLLTATVDQRKPIFLDWHLGRQLVLQFRQAQEMRLVTSLCWVVMPDHFHWLVQLEQGTLAELMCRVKSRSSLAVNQISGTRERLWQRGYHDRAVRREEELRTIARYIVMNPVRAGLVRRVGDYPLWDAVWL